MRLRHPILEHAFARAALTLDLFLWLWSLPVLLRLHTVPALLERIGSGAKRPNASPLELQDAAAVVARVCNLKPFRTRVFPKPCLRHSLALYRTLIRLGYPPQIHIGVRKSEGELIGHSWVSLHGQCVADTSDSAVFKSIYSHAPIERRTGRIGERSPNALLREVTVMSKQSDVSRDIQGLGCDSSAQSKKKWQEPKLTFIKPKLTNHGKLEEVTGQFFGAFSPGRISTIR